MEKLARCALWVFPALEEIAANGSLIHNDDILSVNGRPTTLASASN